jgi:hypothetical protein
MRNPHANTAVESKHRDDHNRDRGEFDGRSSRTGGLPTLYLSSRTSSELRAKFWAPLDLLHDSPIATDRHQVGRGGVSIEMLPVYLRFGKTDDTVDFKVDAQHLLCAREISSVWPQSPFFGTVTSDDYDMQLVLETPNGRVESPVLKVRIDSSRLADQTHSHQAKP